MHVRQASGIGQFSIDFPLRLWSNKTKWERAMRTRVFGDGIRVRAIAGTHTVLLALDADRKSRKGLLGFAIHRRDPAENQAYWLKGLKVFRSVVPRPEPKERYTTLEHPIQSFLWGDYTAKPGRTYGYTIRPVYGSPKNLEYGGDIEFEVSTEPYYVKGETHSIFFNRGAIAGQFYADEFGNEPPPEPDNPERIQTMWLSRGLLEACLQFINETPKGDALRVAAYEFTYQPVLQALKKAIRRGVNVKIVYEAGKDKVKGKLVETEATKSNKKAIKEAGLPVQNLIKRTNRKNIPHNKFIVRLKGGKDPKAVWTGSTNFTPSGFLGQTNVGHRIDDPEIAERYFRYWTLLSADPLPEDLVVQVEDLTPAPDALSKNNTASVFSPRQTADMLEWYADRIRAAKQTVMFTGGFGVNDTLARAFAEDREFLRFILLEKPPSSKKKLLLGPDNDLVVVYGNVLGEAYQKNKKGELTLRRKIPGFELTRWFLEEEHYRKFGNIFFIHTKLLLIDPLSQDPLIFSGSANFSDDSLRKNDENMLLIRGDTRVADIYLSEFDRILRHFHFRDIAAEASDNGGAGEAKFLKEKAEDWQERYFTEGEFKDRRRRMFF
jgi:phosphatidylserine/phosphatidylglycerophosphate/cardiolipin synthase-like enzyme